MLSALGGGRKHANICYLEEKESSKMKTSYKSTIPYPLLGNPKSSENRKF
jgi:hypothetical protein